MIGTVLQGRYKIIDKLGTGGFSDTYKAEDLHLPVTPLPQCVVKRLQPTTKMHPDIQRLFEKEAKILYELGQEHDQIPKLYAYFEQNGDFYLIQELIDGYDLNKEIIPTQPMSEDYVTKLLQDILKILAFVHQRNIIHRDIKPANIMRCKEGDKLVLIDFGAVKEVSTSLINAPGLSSRTVVVGTPGYMPNEQAAGKPKPSSDIYAVGMLAIQALTGILPHQLPEDNDGEVVWRDRVSVSDFLAEILTKMVLYDFRQRYQSAVEALLALKPPGGSPQNQPPPPKPYKIDKKYGYKDEAGQIVIQPEFEEAWDFYEGLAVVKIGSKFGYIDQNGLPVIPPSFNKAGDFSEGLAVVKVGSKFGFIDQKGQFVISPQFCYCSKFSEGLAVVGIYEKWLGVPYNIYYGYINKVGVVTIRPQFDIGGNFSEGLAKVWICSMGGLKGCKWGYIDTRGEVVIKPQFDGAGDFCEGLAWVKIGSQVGYINRSGRIAIDPQFDEATNFSQGRAKVRIGGQWSDINTKGNFAN